MKQFAVLLLPSVRKDLRRIPGSFQERLIRMIYNLGGDPFPPGCTKLQGYADTYRIRAGQYRIVYDVKTVIRIVTIMRIGHRKDVYGKL